MSSASSATAADAAVPAKTPRELVLLKKQAKAEAEASQYTFKPNVKTNKAVKVADSAGEPGSNVFTKLYESKKKQPEVAEAAPVTSPKKKVSAESINRLYSGNGSGKPRASVSGTAEDAAAAPGSSSKDKDKKTPPPKKAISAAEAQAAASRLYAEADKIRQKLEERKGELEKEFSTKNTFKPTLEKRKDGKSGAVGSDGAAGTSDITERMRVYTEEKNKRLEEAAKAKRDQEAAQNTFRPTLLSSNSKRASTSSASPPPAAGAEGGGHATATSADVAVFERLSAAKPKPAAAVAPADHTFKPQLATKKSGAANSGAAKGETSSVPVHERLFEKGVEHANKMEALRKQTLEEELKRSCTFAPTVGGGTGGHARSGSGNAGSEKADRGASPVFERLSSTPLRAGNYDELKDEKDLAECTFRPKVSELASSIRHEAPVHDRLNAENEMLRREAEKREAQRLEAELKGATFVPSISEASKQLALKRLMARAASMGGDGSMGTDAASPGSSPSRAAKAAARDSPTPATSADSSASAMDALASSVIAAKPPVTPTAAGASSGKIASAAKKATPPRTSSSRNNTNSNGKSGTAKSMSNTKSTTATKGRTSATASPVVRTMADIAASLSSSGTSTPIPATTSAPAPVPEPAPAPTSAVSHQEQGDSDDEDSTGVAAAEADMSAEEPSGGGIVSMEDLLAGSGGLHILGTKMKLSTQPAASSTVVAPVVPEPAQDAAAAAEVELAKPSSTSEAGDHVASLPAPPAQEAEKAVTEGADVSVDPPHAVEGEAPSA